MTPHDTIQPQGNPVARGLDRPRLNFTEFTRKRIAKARSAEKRTQSMVGKQGVPPYQRHPLKPITPTHPRMAPRLPGKDKKSWRSVSKDQQHEQSHARGHTFDTGRFPIGGGRENASQNTAGSPARTFHSPTLQIVPLTAPASRGPGHAGIEQTPVSDRTDDCRDR